MSSDERDLNLYLSGLHSGIMTVFANHNLNSAEDADGAVLALARDPLARQELLDMIAEIDSPDSPKERSVIVNGRLFAGDDECPVHGKHCPEPDLDPFERGGLHFAMEGESGARRIEMKGRHIEVTVSEFPDADMAEAMHEMRTVIDALTEMVKA